MCLKKNRMESNLPGLSRGVFENKKPLKLVPLERAENGGSNEYNMSYVF